MKPATMGVTLRLDPSDMRHLSRICEDSGVTRSAFVVAAVQDALDTMAYLRRMKVSGAPPRDASHGGETAEPVATAAAEAERPVSRAVPVRAEPRVKDRRIGNSRRSNRRVTPSGVNRVPTPSLELALPAGMETFRCDALRAPKLTERGCAQNKARKDLADICGHCPGVRALAEAGSG